MKKEKVVIIGGKGTAVVVGEHIEDATIRGANVELLGYAFDDLSNGNDINGTPILCGTRDAFVKYGSYDDVFFIYQMYRSDIVRERIALKESLGIPIDRYYTFVHPSAVVMKSVKIGRGSVVVGNVVIMPNARIGNFCSILATTTIGHDTVMGDHNFLATHCVIGSMCKIGDANFFGMNVTLNTRATIGDDCYMAMASNVVKDLENGSRVRGNPAASFQNAIKPT